LKWNLADHGELELQNQQQCTRSKDYNGKDVSEQNVVTQSRTGSQIYEGRDDQLSRPGPMA
jgi:hypothetical protein